ncbi:uncharacterized protein EV154DRAFT_554333 [Mucor mucedo]|uniref:uncharacterized protein n=1 Tax=Mucor mucedo TaxID=29922 RepID=UPI00221F088C|nr:uncharacterized protein EV154DRAFT_554333 [Mucor mucedo]KAI7887790.1 hypothetical protein EV154DRAFT_554333 [Mucor mucedo]
MKTKKARVRLCSSVLSRKLKLNSQDYSRVEKKEYTSFFFDEAINHQVLMVITLESNGSSLLRTVLTINILVAPLCSLPFSYTTSPPITRHLCFFSLPTISHKLARKKCRELSSVIPPERIAKRQFGIIANCCRLSVDDEDNDEILLKIMKELNDDLPLTRCNRTKETKRDKVIKYGRDQKYSKFKKRKAEGGYEIKYNMRSITREGR